MAEYNHASLVHWMQNKDIMHFIPSNVDIDLTKDCYYCISAEFRKTTIRNYDYSKYIALLDQLASWREHSPASYGTLHSITFSGGGEPTMLKKYEKVIEHSVNLGFLTNLTTNGVLLDKLINNVDAATLKKINWIGVDIDAGTEPVYEEIRRGNTPSMFARVVDNIKELVNIGVNVDLKVLVTEYNSRDSHINDMFKLARKLGVRMVYYRPSIVSGKIFTMTDNFIRLIRLYSAKHSVQYKLNITKSEPRTYEKCHQMFQFPSFCADGNIYSCCDHKGDLRFNIGNWDTNDFRDNWLNAQHWGVYDSIDVSKCPPCRPNWNNIQIQECIDDTEMLCILNT